MKKILTIVFLYLLLINYSNATYQALGAVSCGDVITSDKNNNKSARYQISDWMRGYITGRNYPNVKKGKNLNDDAIFYEILNYCKKNPLHNTPEAAEIFYNKLK